MGSELVFFFVIKKLNSSSTESIPSMVATQTSPLHKKFSVIFHRKGCPPVVQQEQHCYC